MFCKLKYFLLKNPKQIYSQTKTLFKTKVTFSSTPHFISTGDGAAAKLAEVACGSVLQQVETRQGHKVGVGAGRGGEEEKEEGGADAEGR